MQNVTSQQTTNFLKQIDSGNGEQLIIAVNLVMAHLGRLCWNNGCKMCLVLFYRKTHIN